MPRHPDPDNLPPHKFPHQLIQAIAENSHDSAFFLLTRGSEGNFNIIPHFTNQADVFAFYSFLQVYAASMLENISINLDNQITQEFFGDEGEPE